jgi:hypothetical protein
MDNGWNPGYYDKWENFHPYEKKWYCTNNKIIHQSEKEKNNCKHCICKELSDGKETNQS